MLPSGPGGVRRFSLRGAQPSTPSHTAHSTRAALEREFNPAEADCGLQGTASSPSSTATASTTSGGEAAAVGRAGVRRQVWRRGRDSNPRHGCPCTAFPVPHLRPLGHLSCTSGPSRNWRRGEDLNPRGTFWAPIRFRVGRLRPGSATPPRQCYSTVIEYLIPHARAAFFAKSKLDAPWRYHGRPPARSSPQRQQGGPARDGPVYPSGDETRSERMWRRGPGYPFRGATLRCE